VPYEDPDPADPQVLNGVVLPGDASSTRAMVEAFADEFAQMGFDGAAVLRLFRNPFYAGAHAALALMGEDEVSRIVEESVRVFGGSSRGDRCRR
jgi:hypothetical protein